MPATVAALQQVEKGDLDLAAPVADYCPEFASIQVLTGFADGQPQYRPPATQATVHQLITHTSGLGYWFWNTELVEWERPPAYPMWWPGCGAA
jgi:CubicO group peptidase (beta-lactamase class C family)